MLALREYGSSDDNGGSDEETKEVKNTKDTNVVSNEHFDSAGSLAKIGTTLALQVCAAPEVVPMVSSYIFLLIKFISRLKTY